MEVHFSREGIFCLGWIVIFWQIVVFRESGPGPSQKTKDANNLSQHL